LYAFFRAKKDLKKSSAFFFLAITAIFLMAFSPLPKQQSLYYSEFPAKSQSIWTVTSIAMHQAPFSLKNHFPL
jgi:hypothetical protein